MGRLINLESAGKERTRLTRAIVLALRELMRCNEPDDLARDLAAFVSLALLDIGDTVEGSVAAWEKKGYWVKADRFRLDWEWSTRLGQAIQQSLLKDDWANIALLSVQTAQKLMKVKVPLKNRLGTPWVGAWEKLRNQFH